MAKVLITGGTGLLGKALTDRLLMSGHEVVLLSRTARPSAIKGVSVFAWDIHKKIIDPAALNGVEYVVHLAGSGIADHRWTDAVKQEAVSSRVDSMKLLEQAIRERGIRLKAFTGGAAIGYYGMITSSKVFSETDPPATDDFLVQCCRAWEASYAGMSALADKCCVIRIGVVLSKEGGALKRMLPVFRWGLGSPLGTGEQYMPWIHINDLVEILFHSLFRENMQGTYNAAAPVVVTNREFSKQLAAILQKPFFAPPVPGFIIRAMYGEMGNVVLKGSAVSVQRLLDSGFKFRFPELQMALKYELNKGSEL